MTVNSESFTCSVQDNPCVEKKKRLWQTGKKRLLPIALVLALGVALAAGGIWAYMTDTDGEINKFTIGDVHITAQEPNFPTKDKDGNGVPDDCELLTPLEEVLKDPSITNTGTNDCIVFFRVTVPVEELNLIDDNGKRGERQMADIFWMKQKEDPASLHQNHFDENWVELTQLDHKFVDCEGINNEGKGYTYIFGYHVKLRHGETTSNLFDKIQNKKYGSRTITANEVEQIRLESYAIQAEKIVNAGIDINTSGTLNEATLTHIYKVFVNQNVEEVGGKTW